MMTMTTTILRTNVLALLLLQIIIGMSGGGGVEGWSIVKQQQPTPYNIDINIDKNRCDDDDNIHTKRRNIIVNAPQLLLLSSVTWYYSGFTVDNNIVANAVTMEPPTKTIFKVGESLGIDQCKIRLKESMETIQYLLNNYDTICSTGGGDNIRRYLGTVGTTSSLYGINKVLRELQKESDIDDIVIYTDSMEDFDYWLRAADTAAYSSMFVEFSAASTKPEKYFIDAKNAIEKMKNLLNIMSIQLNL